MEPFATGWLGVDLKTTPTGDLAFPDFIGAIKRIVYSPSNRSPSAVLGATPTNGPAPLAVLFDAAGSTDPNGDPLTYDWDFGDGTQHGSQRNPLQTYTQAGVYTARITVSDGRGLSDTKTITIAVSTHPPMASITSPPNGSLYRDGQTNSAAGHGLGSGRRHTAGVGFPVDRPSPPRQSHPPAEHVHGRGRAELHRPRGP